MGILCIRKLWDTFSNVPEVTRLGSSGKDGVLLWTGQAHHPLSLVSKTGSLLCLHRTKKQATFVVTANLSSFSCWKRLRGSYTPGLVSTTQTYVLQGANDQCRDSRNHGSQGPQMYCLFLKIHHQ